MKKKLVVIFTATSGVGKSTLSEEVLKRHQNIIVAITTTSRKPRSTEKNGRDYYFVTKEEFEKMIQNGDFFEWEQSFNEDNSPGDYYGLTKAEWHDLQSRPGDVILIIPNIKGAITYKEKIPESVVVLIKVESLEEVEKRLRERNQKLDPATRMSEEKIAKRIRASEEEARLPLSYNYSVVNRRNQFEGAVRELEEIIQKELAKQQ